jgi:hypothetical protein
MYVAPASSIVDALWILLAIYFKVTEELLNFIFFHVQLRSFAVRILHLLQRLIDLEAKMKQLVATKPNYRVGDQMEAKFIRRQPNLCPQFGRRTYRAH